MKNLLKADFIRLKNDLLTKIVLIASVAFALFTTLLYLIISKTMGDEVSEMLGMLINGKTMFISSFSMSNNIGIAIPIILAIFMCKDFTYLTIRNKLIMGQPRYKVYLSSYIISSIIGLTIITLYSLSCLGFGTLMLGYGPTETNEFWVIIRALLEGWLIYLVLFSILAMMAFVTKSTSLTIITVIVTTIIELIIYSVIITVGSTATWAQVTTKLLMLGQITLLGDGSASLYIVISSIVKIILINLGGIMLFSKNDLK